MASERDDLARLLEQHPAYSTGNDQQDLFKAREAADAILAAGWVSPEDYREAFLRMGRATATVQRVRALCDEALRACAYPPGYINAQTLRAALAPPPGPAAPGGHGEGRA